MKRSSYYWVLPLFSFIGIGIILVVTLATIDPNQELPRETTTVIITTSATTTTTTLTQVPITCPEIIQINRTKVAEIALGFIENSLNYTIVISTRRGILIGSILTDFNLDNAQILELDIFEFSAATENFIVLLNEPILADIVILSEFVEIPVGHITGSALFGGFLYLIKDGSLLLKINPATGTLYASIPLSTSVNTIAISPLSNTVFTDKLSILNLLNGEVTISPCTVVNAYDALGFDSDGKLHVY